MKFATIIARYRLRAHKSHDTGLCDWKHLSAVVLAYHTSEWCVRMHFASVPCGEVCVVAVLNAIMPVWCTVAVLSVATLIYMRLDVLVGLATGAELLASLIMAVWLHAYVRSFDVLPTAASTLVATLGFAGSFGTTPISTQDADTR